MMGRGTALLIFQALVGVSVLLTALTAGAEPKAGTRLQPFTTDGCSRFPDRAPGGHADWCHCCVVHDLAYWRGGTEDERLKADQALKMCVEKASGSKVLADIMYAGVRAGGGPQFATPYRWGYGWPVGRPYKQLSPQEDALAAKLAKEYLASNPQLICLNNSK
jgi:hypothetical protein